MASGQRNQGFRSGKSLGVGIPRSFAEEVGLGGGTEVRITAEEGEFLERPAKPSRLRLEELLSGVPSENIHASDGTGDAGGGRNVLMASAYDLARRHLDCTPQPVSKKGGGCRL